MPKKRYTSSAIDSRHNENQQWHRTYANRTIISVRLFDSHATKNQQFHHSSDRFFVLKILTKCVCCGRFLLAPIPPRLHLPHRRFTMSSNNSSTSASVAANQALVDLLARVEVLIQRVLQAATEKEKMALSRIIAREVVSILCLLLIDVFWFY